MRKFTTFRDGQRQKTTQASAVSVTSVESDTAAVRGQKEVHRGKPKSHGKGCVAKVEKDVNTADGRRRCDVLKPEQETPPSGRASND